MTTVVEEATKETVSSRLAWDVKARAKATANETATFVDHQGITQERAPTHTRAKAKTVDFKENGTGMVGRAITQGSAQKATKDESQKEKETITKGKAKDRGIETIE